MITRTMGKLLRGKATPFQVGSACVLGALVSFLPSILICPELYIIFFALVLILNTNLFVAALTAIPCKIIALLLSGLSVTLGKVVLGNLGFVFRPLINSPLFAWCGLEYHLVIGSLSLGLLFGLGLAIVVVRTLTLFRKTMATLEEGSEKYKTLMKKKSFRLLVWIFFGSDKTKGSYEDLLEKKVGNPIRILGVVIVLFGALTMGAIAFLYQAGMLKTQLEKTLTKANGASVEIEGLTLSLLGGNLAIKKLSLCDTANLERNAYELNDIQAALSVRSLLTKRIRLENLLVAGVIENVPRHEKGVLVQSSKSLDDSGNKTEEAVKTSSLPAEKSMEDLSLSEYFSSYESYVKKSNEMYTQGQAFLDHPRVQAFLNKKKNTDDTHNTVTNYLIAFLGSYSIEERLVDPAPFFHIKKATFEKILFKDPYLNDAVLAFSDFSSQPEVLELPPRITVENKKQGFAAQLIFKQAKDTSAENELLLSLEHIDGKTLGKEFTVQQSHPLKDGDFSLNMKGVFQTNLASLVAHGSLKGRAVLIDAKAVGDQLESAFAKAGSKTPKEYAFTLDTVNINFSAKPFASPPEIKASMGDIKKQLMEEATKAISTQGKALLLDTANTYLKKSGVSTEIPTGAEAEKEVKKELEKAATKEINSLIKGLF